MPWLWIASFGLAVSLLVTGYWWNQRTTAAELRTRILGAYEGPLGTAAQRYRGFRTQIESWVVWAAEHSPPEPHADPLLRIAGLHSIQGIYLRLAMDDAGSPQGIQRGARAMTADAITRCLGIAPISLRGFYEHGDFLMPGWTSRAAEGTGVMTLRVVDSELTRRTRRDLPSLMNATDAEYFLLVLQRGPNRGAHPVDVYVWGLRERKLLLALTARSQGVLVPARIALPGVSAPRGAQPVPHSTVAHDCSIASQIKEQTGEPSLTFESEVQEPAPQEPAQEPSADTPAAPPDTVEDNAEPAGSS